MGNILKIRNKSAPTPGAHIIGVQLSKEMNGYLSLYCMAKGVTKSVIIRELLAEWIKTIQKENSEDHLMNSIALKSITAFKLRQTNYKKKKLTLPIFLSNLEKELSMRINPTEVHKIIETIEKYGTDKKDTATERANAAQN